jgi:hypothetical protein
MNTSSVWAMLALAATAALGLLTLFTEKKEEGSKSRKLSLSFFTMAVAIFGGFQIWSADDEAQKNNKAQDDRTAKIVSLSQENKDLTTQNGELLKHDTEAVQAAININSYIVVLKKHQTLRREVAGLLSKNDVDVYTYDLELAMPDVNVRQELTYAHPTPERVAEINALVKRQKQEIADGCEIRYTKEIRKPMIDLYKQIIAELVPTLGEAESKRILEDVSEPANFVATRQKIERLRDFAAQMVP